MQLHLFDHRHHLDINLRLAKIEFQEIINALPDGIEIADYDCLPRYAIIHISNPTPQEIDSQFPLDECTNLQIFFCLTTNNNLGYSDKEYKHYLSQNRQRYVLYGRKLDDLNKPEILRKVLKAFLSLTAEQAEAIVERNFDKIPKDLIDIFHVNKFENLATLSILCQGYLAVHPNTNLNNKLIAYLPSDVNPKITKTEDCEWWQNLFTNETKETLTTKIKKEWQPQKLPQKVEDLIKAIYSNQSITEVKMIEEVDEAIAEYFNQHGQKKIEVLKLLKLFSTEKSVVLLHVYEDRLISFALKQILLLCNVTANLSSMSKIFDLPAHEIADNIPVLLLWTSNCQFTQKRDLLVRFDHDIQKKIYRDLILIDLSNDTFSEYLKDCKAVSLVLDLDEQGQESRFSPTEIEAIKHEDLFNDIAGYSTHPTEIDRYKRYLKHIMPNLKTR